MIKLKSIIKEQISTQNIVKNVFKNEVFEIIIYEDDNEVTNFMFTVKDGEKNEEDNCWNIQCQPKSPSTNPRELIYDIEYDSFKTNVTPELNDSYVQVSENLATALAEFATTVNPDSNVNADMFSIIQKY